ncbi:MAG: hypothetical protein DI539_11055 [Flavobacterium psychrophilum]|nr:MAG: hypothetical protein DI539_11055 [Flavobacterium psychrophilum]
MTDNILKNRQAMNHQLGAKQHYFHGGLKRLLTCLFFLFYLVLNFLYIQWSNIIIMYCIQQVEITCFYALGNYTYSLI